MSWQQVTGCGCSEADDKALGKELQLQRRVEVLIIFDAIFYTI